MEGWFDSIEGRAAGADPRGIADELREHALSKALRHRSWPALLAPGDTGTSTGSSG
jgi:hypothetical protein